MATKTKKKTATKKKAAAKKAATKKAAPKKKAAVKKKKSTAAKKPAAKPKSKAKAKSKTAPAKPKKSTASKKKAVAPKKSTKAKATKPSKAKTAAKNNAPDKSAVAKAAAPAKKFSKPRPKPKGKILPRQFLFDLGQAVKEAVLPAIQEGRGREVAGTAISGDATFELDKLAEKALLTYLKNARSPVAYYSEDAGYSTFSSAQPKHLLLVDPVDGTRAAKNGFEGCVVSIASTRVIERPTIGDIDNACVIELMNDRVFYAERGAGARVYTEGIARRAKLSENTNLEELTWSMTVPGRPAELIFPTAARLIDLSSLKGGFFACNSTAFSLTRLLTGQQDATVDFATRYLRDCPNQVQDYFLNAGRGAKLGIAPYDIAAALLIAQEAGAVVTDAYGRGFDDVLILDSSSANHLSMIGAANEELHAKLMNFFDTRIKQFEALLKRRGGD